MYIMVFEDVVFEDVANDIPKSCDAGRKRSHEFG